MQTNHLTNYQTVIKAPVERVWDALVNPEIVRLYFFGSNMVSDWKVGSPINFTGEFDGKAYNDKGIVKEFVPNKRLSFTYLSDWSGKEDMPENYLYVTYEVEPVEDGTLLKITQTNYDAEKAKHSEENWAGVIEGLRKIVE